MRLFHSFLLACTFQTGPLCSSLVYQIHYGSGLNFVHFFVSRTVFHQNPSCIWRIFWRIILVSQTEPFLACIDAILDSGLIDFS